MNTFEDSTHLERTSTGLLLMIIGFVLEWIPDIDILGAIIGIIGAILVIMERKMFGHEHEKFVNISIALYVISIIAITGTGIGFISAAVVDASSHVDADGAFNTFFIAIIVLAIIAGLSYVLFVYQISTDMGKKILIAAYIAQIFISMLIFYITTPRFDLLFSNLSDLTSREASLTSSLQYYLLLDAIPFLLYAYAYYLVRNKILKMKNRTDSAKQQEV